jgi:hypothetical protein
MKTRIVILVLAFTCSARATLIDVTPGGFSLLNPPQVYIDWVNGVYGPQFGIAYDTQSGWDPIPLGTAILQLNSIGRYHGYTLLEPDWNAIHHCIRVCWQGPNGWINMYQVSADQIISGEGPITINGQQSV